MKLGAAPGTGDVEVAGAAPNVKPLADDGADGVADAPMNGGVGLEAGAAGALAANTKAEDEVVEEA